METIRKKKILNSDGVDAVMNLAKAKAKENGLRVVVAVVDDSGNLLRLERPDDAQVASVNVAVDKARTAAIFVRPSREIEEQVSGGRLGALALHGAAALTGGIPLWADGQVVGAIGTSGERPDEDESVSLAGAGAPISTSEVPALTYEGARLAAESAAREAGRRGVAPVAAVVDAAGELVYLWRPDRAQVASVKVAADKARTAAIYRRPSKDFEDQTAHGRPSALHLAGAVPLQGGIPIVSGGRVIGAIGISGATSADEDQELALIGAHAIGNGGKGGRDATFFSDEAVTEKFGTGGLLLDTEEYKVDAGRREKPGEVEYHEHVTDIMHVVNGTATVVTGGEMIEPRSVGNGEMRARSIEGGSSRELSKGDVLAIPSGVPHQFTRVSDPFLYFVVKVVS
jgi:glc operon protein GlcG